MKETIKTYQNWNDTNDLIFQGIRELRITNLTRLPLDYVSFWQWVWKIILECFSTVLLFTVKFLHVPNLYYFSIDQKQNEIKPM